MSYAAENEEQEDEEQDILVLRTLELLLPSFYRKLDEHGELDLMDAMPANQYKGNGVHLLAIQPSDGSIHSICYGRSNVPLDFYDPTFRCLHAPRVVPLHRDIAVWLISQWVIFYLHIPMR